MAVLGVLAYHAGLPVPGGYLGVDVFFVVSGFVITTILKRELDDSGRVDLRRFFSRRVRRLAPALAVVSVATLVMCALVLSPTGPQQTAARTAVAAQLLIANVVIARSTGDYFGAAASLNPFLHTWSLSVEEQFYLVLPVLLLLVWRRGRWGRAPALALVAITGLVSFAWAALVAADVAASAAFYHPLGRVWEFCFGALVALVSVRLRRTWVTPAGTLGLAAVLMSFAIAGPSTTGGLVALPAVVGTALVILAGAAGSGPVHRWMSAGTLRHIGDHSYSLYLWHWPVIVAASLVIGTQVWALVGGALISVIPAVLAYRYVEEPVRRGQLLRSLSAPRIAAACAVPVLVGAVALHAAAATGYGNESVLAAQRARSEPALGREGCGAGLRMCVIEPHGGGTPIYLLGDSHAGHFSDAVVQVGRDLNRPVSLSLAFSCPFVALDVHQGLGTGCMERNVALGADIAAGRPGTVVLAASDVYWTTPSWTVVGPHGEVATTPEARIEVWRVALLQTVTALRESGHQVVLVQSIPLQPEFDLDRCPMRDIMSNSCDRQLDIRAAMRDQGAARAVIADVAARTSSVVMDPWEVLCTDGRCLTGRSPYLYRNWSHLSVEGSLRFVPSMVDALAAAESG